MIFLAFSDDFSGRCCWFGCWYFAKHRFKIQCVFGYFLQANTLSLSLTKRWTYQRYETEKENRTTKIASQNKIKLGVFVYCISFIWNAFWASSKFVSILQRTTRHCITFYWQICCLHACKCTTIYMRCRAKSGNETFAEKGWKHSTAQCTPNHKNEQCIVHTLHCCCHECIHASPDQLFFYAKNYLYCQIKIWELNTCSVQHTWICRI